MARVSGSDDGGIGVRDKGSWVGDDGIGVRDEGFQAGDSTIDGDDGVPDDMGVWEDEAVEGACVMVDTVALFDMPDSSSLNGMYLP